MNMYAAALTGIVVTMSIALLRAIKGPTVFDRILAANMFGTKTILLIALAGFWSGRPDWMDLALVYALVNFTSTIAVLKFVRFGDFAVGDEDRSPQSGRPQQSRAHKSSQPPGPLKETP